MRFIAKSIEDVNSLAERIPRNSEIIFFDEEMKILARDWLVFLSVVGFFQIGGIFMLLSWLSPTTPLYTFLVLSVFFLGVLCTIVFLRTLEISFKREEGKKWI